MIKALSDYSSAKIIVENSPQELVSALLKFPRLRKTLLQHSHGQMVYQLLAKDHCMDMIKFLTNLQTDEFLEVLKYQNSSRNKPTVINIAFANSECIQFLLLTRPALWKILSTIQDTDGSLVFHIISREKALSNILLGIDESDAISILSSLNSQNGCPVGCHFAAMNPKYFVHVMVRLHRAREAMMTIADANGWLPFHILAQVHSLELVRMLQQLNAAAATAVLQASNTRSKLPVAVLLGAVAGVALEQIFHRLPELRPALLTIDDEGGWLAYHHFVPHPEFCSLLLDMEDEEAVRVLSATNRLNRQAVIHSLAERAPATLTKVALRRPGARSALLSLADSDGCLAAHLLAAHHPASLLALLEGLSDSDATELLLTENAKTREVVAVALSRRRPARLRGLVAARPAVGAALLGFRDADGGRFHPVGGGADAGFVFCLGPPGRPGTLDLPRLLSHVRFAEVPARRRRRLDGRAGR